MGRPEDYPSWVDRYGDDYATDTARAAAWREYQTVTAILRETYAAVSGVEQDEIPDTDDCDEPWTEEEIEANFAAGRPPTAAEREQFGITD